MKIIEFHSNFIEIWSQDSNWQYASIGSGNGLSPNRRKSITWTNDDPVHWRIYASLWGNELIMIPLIKPEYNFAYDTIVK